MSRQIDHTRPYTDEEKAYLLTRANGEDLIKINDRRFAGVDDSQREALRLQAERDDANDDAERRAALQEYEDDPDAYHPDDIETVENMTTKQIREVLAKVGLRSAVSDAEQVLKDDDGNETKLTEKQVLAYRLLDYYDAARRSQ